MSHITTNIEYIPVGKLHPHPDNPRKIMANLTELAESIKANGILQILYVRETWREYNGKYYYKANECCDYDDYVTKKLPSAPKWHSYIHMPREAARIFLLVTNVRIERLQDMTMDDIRREGVVPTNVVGGQWQQWQHDYMRPTWDSTIKPAERDKYGWAANPWVWVIEFERCEKPERGRE